MQNNQNETDVTPRTQDYVRIAVVGGALAYSAFALGRLGYDLGKEGIRTLKEKKRTKTEN